ncbi:MAG: hypothetical protein M3R59_04890 [Verrucomicrobiota bacterium]|nr:hypothetical protein [Verrucomicrobiota bacterium]
MKRFLLVTVLATLSTLPSSIAQTAAPDARTAQLLAMLKDVEVQQTQIVANQAEIETKLAAVAETIRVARIYSSRGGH